MSKRGRPTRVKGDIEFEELFTLAPVKVSQSAFVQRIRTVASFPFVPLWVVFSIERARPGVVFHLSSNDATLPLFEYE